LDLNILRNERIKFFQFHADSGLKTGELFYGDVTQFQDHLIIAVGTGEPSVTHNFILFLLQTHNVVNTNIVLTMGTLHNRKSFSHHQKYTLNFLQKIFQIHIYQRFFKYLRNPQTKINIVA
jgi:hypothetical protein